MKIGDVIVLEFRPSQNTMIKLNMIKRIIAYNVIEVMHPVQISKLGTKNYKDLLNKS